MPASCLKRTTAFIAQPNVHFAVTFRGCKGQKPACCQSAGIIHIVQMPASCVKQTTAFVAQLDGSIQRVAKGSTFLLLHVSIIHIVHACKLPATRCCTAVYRLYVAKLRCPGLAGVLAQYKKRVFKGGESRGNFCRWLPSEVFVEDVFLFEVSRQKQCQTNAYG